ncbi:MFS transporter [Oceanobacillus polygoni]|uniref:GPH family glycoside/pentoside/hexuronide:cation symporter n=1 Tax=Oceanobacillus polygoni TaxID=1235259 RepID=A0A9X0YUH0_9BACI|nr:glycoside-pentoside-hexuronide (GPH):cation symporter [Oceanobacillus polygoni]MBP2079073.1 GPH family glycoside/pentoside/hexuronide:cation symporter [Oceanobacillus polygoni]
MKKQRKFGIRDQVGYALGDIGGSFVNLYIGAFFLVFATYVLGVSPYFMGTLFLVSRVFDAFTDVVMGTIPDRWRIGKSGDKFLPYISIAKWFLAASLLVSFVDVSSFSTTMIHIWVVVVYNFYGVAYTADSIPYGSLAAVITRDPVERTKLSRARAIGGMIVGMGALSIVPMFVYDSAGNVIPEGFFNVAIVFSILSLLSYTALVRLTTERVRDDNPTGKKIDYKFKDALKAALTNRPLIGMMIASIGSLLIINGVNQLAAIVFAEYYKMPSAFTINSIVNITIVVILFFSVPKLVEVFEKRNLVIVSSAFSLIAITLLTLFTIENVYVFIALYNIATLGLMIFVMIVWALVTDCLDYTELKTGRRYDGTLFSIYSFSRKVGMGVGSAIGSYALGWVGFVSGAESQSAEVAANIYRLYTGLPIIAFILMLVGVGLIFNLNRTKTDSMYEELKERRA